MENLLVFIGFKYVCEYSRISHDLSKLKLSYLELSTQQTSYYGEPGVRLQMESMIIKSKHAKYLSWILTVQLMLLSRVLVSTASVQSHLVEGR